MASHFIVIVDFVVVVIVNVVINVAVIIVAGVNAVSINVRVHGEGKAPDDITLINSDNLRVGGGDFASSRPPS